MISLTFSFLWRRQKHYFHFKLSRLPPHFKSVKYFVKMLRWNFHFCFQPRWALNIKGVKHYNITVQRRLVWYCRVSHGMFPSTCILYWQILLCHFQNRLDIVQVPWTSVRLTGLSLQVCIIYVKERCPSMRNFFYSHTNLRGSRERRKKISLLLIERYSSLLPFSARQSFFVMYLW